MSLSKLPAIAVSMGLASTIVFHQANISPYYSLVEEGIAVITVIWSKKDRMKDIVRAIKDKLTLQKIDSYTKHGCCITGELYLIEHMPVTDRIHPRAGQFGACAYIDGLEAAKLLVRETIGDKFVVELGIPDLVVRKI